VAYPFLEALIRNGFAACCVFGFRLAREGSSAVALFPSCLTSNAACFSVDVRLAWPRFDSTIASRVLAPILSAALEFLMWEDRGRLLQLFPRSFSRNTQAQELSPSFASDIFILHSANSASP
jgi:hypothetical protein